MIFISGKCGFTNLKGHIRLENANKDTSVIVFGEKSYCANRLTKDRRALRGAGSKTVVVVMFRGKIKYSVD